ncbi:MAG: hypothetical protein ABJH45_21735 [Paracoccaceae bacterium]
MSSPRNETLAQKSIRNLLLGSEMGFGAYEETAEDSELKDRLRDEYPEDVDEIVQFLVNSLSRRQAIVEKLGKHPDLNDHGFFLVICKMYIDTYKGHGYPGSRLAQLIERCSRKAISRPTVMRKIEKAKTANVFEWETSDVDGRSVRYYLHRDFIKICSEMFGGMIQDVRAPS